MLIIVQIAQLAEVAFTYEPDRIRQKLMEIVPDYKPAEVNAVQKAAESKRNLSKKGLRHSGEMVTA